MKTYTVTLTWMLIAGANLTGCAKEDGQLPSTVTTVVTRDFNQGDAQLTASHYTDDAQILPPQHPAIVGRPAIAAFFKANIDKYIGFGNDTTWSAVRGDVAVEQGVYNIRNVRIGENVETGKYLRVWKKIDGNWELYRDMFSADNEVSGAVSVAPEEPVPSENAVAK
jgi:ketosteroid isomerase-like protein